MMYTQTPEKLAQQQKLDRELAAVLMTIPVAVMFFVFQKRIISGSLEGGVKE